MADEPTAAPAKKGKDTVKVRVLPKGDGKIATGEYDKATNSFTYHKRGDQLELHPTIAEAQENNGHVEIVG